MILYDGVCVFCSRWIRFVAARDSGGGFASPRSSRLRHAFGAGVRHQPDDPDTNAVIHGGVAYFKSDGALTVCQLAGLGLGARALRLVPKPLRDAVYNLVARNLTIFGKYEECFVPDAAMRARVME